MKLSVSVALLLAAGAAGASAQTVRGVVADAGELPVPGVVVQLLTGIDARSWIAEAVSFPL
jgi:hypothetical protein